MSYALVGLGDLPVRLLLSCVSKAQRISNEDFFFLRANDYVYFGPRVSSFFFCIFTAPTVDTIANLL